MLGIGGAIGKLFVSIGADASEFDRGLNHVGNTMKKVADDSEQHGGRIRGVLGGIASTAAGFVTANVFMKLGEGITSMAGSLISANADMETFATTLTTVYMKAAGTEEKARSMAKDTLEWARRFAASTPFEIPEIVDATTRLQAYGLEAKDVLGLTGDMAAAMGKPLMQAVEAIADAQTGELERLKEFGITKAMLIAKNEEFSRGEIVNARGQIVDAEGFNDALMSLMNERFKGGMERQSRTWKGMLSNVQDFVGTFTRTLGAPLFEGMSKGLQGFLVLLNDNQANVQAFAEGLGQRLAAGFEWVGSGIRNALPYFQTALDWIGKFARYLSPDNDYDLMRALFGGNIGPRIDEVVRGIKRAAEITGYFVETIAAGDWGFLRELASEWLGGIDIAAPFDALGKAWGDLAPTGERIGALLGAFKEGIGNLIPEPLTAMIGGMGDMATQAAAGLDPLGDLVDGINALSQGVENSIQWLREHEGVQAVLAGTLTAAATAWALSTAAAIAHEVATKGASAATSIYTGVQWALNAALTANPIGIVVVALAGLAAGLAYAYQTNEDFRQSIDNLWASLQKAIEPLRDFQRLLSGEAPSDAAQAANAEALRRRRMGLPPIEGRAAGGPVWPSQSYIVGEAGPELFSPSTAGNITPASVFGGGGGGLQPVNVYIPLPNGDTLIGELLGDPDKVQRMERALAAVRYMDQERY